MFNLRKDLKTQTPPQAQQPEGLQASSRVLIQAKQVEINGYKFIISKMPCTVAQEVIFKLPTGLVPLISNFSQAEDMAYKMLGYCERVYTDGRANVPLISKVIIDNHVPDFNTLIQLENECLKYNYDFFESGKLLNFLKEGACLAESRVSEILTDLLDKYLQAAEQHTTN